MQFSVTFFSQQADSVKVKDLENRLETFKPAIKDYSDKMDKSANLDSIKTLATDLEKQSGILIADIRATFKINDDYLIEYSTNIALSQALPNLSSFYQTQAILKLTEGLNQKRPNYYKNLVDIKNYSRRISETKKLGKARKLNNKIIKAFQELITIQKHKK